MPDLKIYDKLESEQNALFHQLEKEAEDKESPNQKIRQIEI